jgi:hypothetical protein
MLGVSAQAIVAPASNTNNKCLPSRVKLFPSHNQKWRLSQKMPPHPGGFFVCLPHTA